MEMRKAMPEIASVVDMFNESGLGPVRFCMQRKAAGL